MRRVTRASTRLDLILSVITHSADAAVVGVALLPTGYLRAALDVFAARGASLIFGAVFATGSVQTIVVSGAIVETFSIELIASTGGLAIFRTFHATLVPFAIAVGSCVLLLCLLTLLRLTLLGLPLLVLTLLRLLSLDVLLIGVLALALCGLIAYRLVLIVL